MSRRGLAFGRQSSVSSASTASCSGVSSKRQLAPFELAGLDRLDLWRRAGTSERDRQTGAAPGMLESIELGRPRIECALADLLQSVPITEGKIVEPSGLGARSGGMISAPPSSDPKVRTPPCASPIRRWPSGVAQEGIHSVRSRPGNRRGAGAGRSATCGAISTGLGAQGDAHLLGPERERAAPQRLRRQAVVVAGNDPPPRIPAALIAASAWRQTGSEGVSVSKTSPASRT